MKYLVIIGACIQFTGIILYIREMIYGRVKPNKVTRILRAIAPIIGSIAAFSEGVRRAILPTFMAGFGPLLVVIASLFIKQSYRKIERIDYLCGILSIIALVGRQITDNALVAIIFSIGSDLLAALPTIKKSRYHAHSEGITPYVGGLLGQCTALFAFVRRDITELLFPCYLIIFNISIIIFLIQRKSIISR